VFACGYFTGTVDFDPGPGTYSRSAQGIDHDSFVTKLSATGQWIWTKTFGSPDSWDGATSLATAVDGSVYVTGQFSGTMKFDPLNPAVPTTLARGGIDGYVARFSPIGEIVWGASLGAMSRALLKFERSGGRT